MSDDQLGEILAPRSLTESLLLTVLSRLGKMELQNAKAETQLEAIIAAQEAADDSRARIHVRLDEMSPTLARTQAIVEAQGGRLDALDPIVSKLKEGQIERRVINKAIAAVIKSGWSRAGGVAAAAGLGAWHWDTLRDWLFKLVGK